MNLQEKRRRIKPAPLPAGLALGGGGKCLFRLGVC